MSEHNGWASFETWQAALWLGEANYMGIVEDRMRDGERDLVIEADDLLDFVEEIILPRDLEGLASDIVTSWISCVNWHEIADAFNADIRGDL